VEQSTNQKPLTAGEAPDYPKDASGAVAANPGSLEALLIPRSAPAGSGRNFYCHYDVVLDGEVIVRDAWEPVFETARHARGITGSVTFLDCKTLKPRLTIKNIEKAAKLTVIENRRDGPRFAKWQPFSLKRAGH
jgi:hypothetical protein